MAIGRAAREMGAHEHQGEGGGQGGGEDVRAARRAPRGGVDSDHSENMVDLYEWATSLNDVGVHKFMIGCADSPCLKTLQALDAPVFDASDLEGKFMFEGGERGRVAGRRWIRRSSC